MIFLKVCKNFWKILLLQSNRERLLLMLEFVKINQLETMYNPGHKIPVSLPEFKLLAIAVQKNAEVNIISPCPILLDFSILFQIFSLIVAFIFQFKQELLRESISWIY